MNSNHKQELYDQHNQLSLEEVLEEVALTLTKSIQSQLKFKITLMYSRLRRVN